MATNTLSNAIVPELLRDNNYANWSSWMKIYLLAQDLWFVVEGIPEPEPEDDVDRVMQDWRKIDARALHAILISCEVDILSQIGEISSAKIVWDKLAIMYGAGNPLKIPGNSQVDIQSEIREISPARNVGDKFATMHEPGDSSNIPEVSLAGEGSVNNDLLKYGDLIKAIYENDWGTADEFLRENEAAKTATVSVGGYTILHEAVFAGHTEIVEKLVALMSNEELEIRGDDGWTALTLAAFRLNTGMVNCMLSKNPNLFNIRDNRNCIPLVMALDVGNIEVAQFLYSVSLPDDRLTLSEIDASMALTLFILLNKFDLALHLLHHYPGTAIVPYMDEYSSPLEALASKSSAFPSGNHLVFWKKWIYACIYIRPVDYTNDIHLDIHEHQNDQVASIIGSVLGLLRRLPSNLLKLLGIKQLYEMKLLHHQACHLLRKMCNEVDKKKGDAVIGAMFDATEGGIVEFIDELVKVDHLLLLRQDRRGRNIFFNAVLHRQPKIFSLICNLKVKNSITNAMDKSGSTILHMAAMLEPSTTLDRIPGEALKMQSELQWFKEVESICPPWIRLVANKEQRTPKELFTNEHKDMVKKGETRMKDTATSCTVIGALITTIMFTAAFNVPGGNNQNTGFPMFVDKKSFTIFIMSDVLSLFCSSASVLIFLGILTSRYEENDFLQSLPRKMITGLLTLFLSIATMMMAFCAGLFILLPGKSWMTIPIICLAIATVILFGFMQFPIIFYMIKSTYGPSIFNRTNCNRWKGTEKAGLHTEVELSQKNREKTFYGGCCLGQRWSQDHRLSKSDRLSFTRPRFSHAPPACSPTS